MYTVKFQKRGLRHAHVLLWLDGKKNLRTPTDIDGVISAELPHAYLYPKLSKAVATYMIHGPCEPLSFPNGTCSKFYPKKFKLLTTIDEDGYPCYRRQDKGIFILKTGIKLDNTNVVPYNPLLLLRYQTHVNTEYCNKSNSIKYLFKYVNKDPDRENLKITNPQKYSTETPVIDEIKQYYDCRYISPCEAVWRIFAFDIHHRWPSVQRLIFYLLYEQPILFKDNEYIDEILHTNDHKRTMLLAWFEANKIYPEGELLTYS